MRILRLDERLAFALDVPALQAQEQINLLGGKVGWIKTNSVFVGGGIEVLKAITDSGSRIFLDLKFHDIPNTLENYANEVGQFGNVGMFNIHASGGRKMMEAVVKKAGETFVNRPLIIAVTILTSIDEKVFDEIGFHGSISDQVLRLAKLAKDSGCDGVVASPLEAQIIKEKLGDDFIVVTPAIRFFEEAKDDQARLATPKNAIAGGSDILVMGRSLLKGGVEAVNRAYAEIKDGLKERGVSY